MKLLRFKKRYWITVLVIIGLYFLGTAGPLFAWSPIKPGYASFEAKTYTVYYPENSQLPEYYTFLDSYIQQYSEHLSLPLKKNIKIIRADKANIKKYLPWMHIESIGGAALQTGDVLYISFEKVEEQEMSEEEFVKHELIHLLHHQNTTLVNSFNASKREYMSEGVPFYAGGPHYYAKKDFLNSLKKVKLEEAKEGDDLYVSDAFTNLDKESGEQYKVSRMLYGEFIGYLITTYGQERFNAFNHAFLENPFMHRELFEEHFGKKLEVVLQEFEEGIL